MSQWTLFSNHGHVLVVLSQDPDARLRDVAQVVGITERAVQKIVRDLQEGGMLSIEKQGRRNRYRLHRDETLRHPLEAHRTIGELLALINDRPIDSKSAAEVTAEPGVDGRPGPPVDQAPRPEAEPEPDIEPEVEPEPELEPEPKPEPEPEPKAETETETGSEPEPEPEPEPTRGQDPASAGKTRRKDAAGDVDPGDQGSLF